MIPEAPLQQTETGLVPDGEGWFVLNAHDAAWKEGQFGAYTRFEGQPRFPQIGINIGVLAPGQPACYYHREDEQEDFLVLSGECLLLIEGEERPLKTWDFVHCPAGTEHVFVGAGDGPCAILAVGTRLRDDVVYPAAEFAQRHGAAVPTETHKPDEAYANLADDVDLPYQPGWLPG
ncbi:MAG: cupin domain-containing protein [Solirubrobacteraceae bacterium]